MDAVGTQNLNMLNDFTLYQDTFLDCEIFESEEPF